MTWRHIIFFHEYKKIYISKEWREWFILTQADVPKTKTKKKGAFVGTTDIKAMSVARWWFYSGAVVMQLS